MDQKEMTPLQALTILYKLSTLASLPKTEHDTALFAAQLLEKVLSVVETPEAKKTAKS